MISIECINYWWSEIEKEWNFNCYTNDSSTVDITAYSKEKRLEKVISAIMQYDESKYPGKDIHDDYINSKKWKQRREGYLRAELWGGGTINCYICGIERTELASGVPWNIHHDRYDFFAHKYFYIELEDLTILCPGCHESLHISLDIILNGSNRALFREHKNRNGKFFDSDGCFIFGKYKGRNVNEAPRSYLSWVERETDSDYDLEILEHSY
jgi:predicted HNH restriction endonuclease